MNQIMPIGKGVVIAIGQNVPRDVLKHFQMAWEDRMPDVPAMVLPDCQIVQRGEVQMFEFTGDISPTFVAEFQRWWEEANRASLSAQG